MARFASVDNPGAGRGKGSKNKLQKRFFDDFLKHWESEGYKSLEIVFREKPDAYLKILASVMPREFIFEAGRVQELGDDELDRLIDLVERRFGNNAREVGGLPQVIEGRAEPQDDRKPAEVLQTVPEAG